MEMNFLSPILRPPAATEPGSENPETKTLAWSASSFGGWANERQEEE